MQIVHIAAEIAPTAKVGGLADVLLGLPREQVRKGRSTSVFLPHYACLDKKDLSRTKKRTPFGIWWGGTWWGGGCEEHTLVDSIKLCLIDSDHPQNYFKRDQIYGFDDDVERFCHFCRASLDYLVANDIKPDIIHLHDWQASLCAWLMRSFPFEDHFKDTKTVLSIHNMEYQGVYSRHALELAGANIHRAKELGPSLLGGAILLADAVVAVSPTYAKEILTPEGGKGLDKELKTRKKSLSGILNGLDYTYWNPATDELLAVKYSSKTFDSKKENKYLLQERLGLEIGDFPLVGCITRLVPQKGIELIKHALHEAFRLKYQMVLIGSTHDPATTKAFNELQEYYSGDPRVRLALVRDEALAHQLFAASDMTIVPSIFEPCGLTQLIALRYGSVPIVRKTGGLADTVVDIEYKKGNGFVFEHATKEGFSWALKRAVDLWNSDREKWKSLAVYGMNQDFSWNIPESNYFDLYSKLH